MKDLLIRQLLKSDLAGLKKATDLYIGENYFTNTELEDALAKSYSGKLCSSFVLTNEDNEILGFRLAYPPGMWSKGKGNHLRPDLWKAPLESVGYFQSLFLAPEVRGGGWGPRLSEAALNVFRELGAEAVVTHAWKESPENSSIRYLTKFGFEPVISYPDYWIDVDYICTLDGKPCRCTAVEMILYLRH